MVKRKLEWIKLRLDYHASLAHTTQLELQKSVKFGHSCVTIFTAVNKARIAIRFPLKNKSYVPFNGAWCNREKRSDLHQTILYALGVKMYV